MSHEVAQTIFAQLGGNRFAMITGAKNFMLGEKSLTFRLPSNPKAVTHVRIDLGGDDLYTVQFFRIGRKATAYQVLKSLPGIYCDQLLDVFEANTGLYATLTARRA